MRRTLLLVNHIGELGFDPADAVKARCDRCKHWGGDDGDGSRIGQCTRVNHDSHGTHGVAWTSDSDGWNSWLKTTAEFGCSLFEVKP